MNPMTVKATTIRPGVYRLGLVVGKKGRAKLQFVMKFYRVNPRLDELRSVPPGVKAEFARGYFK